MRIFGLGTPVFDARRFLAAESDDLYCGSHFACATSISSAIREISGVVHTAPTSGSSIIACFAVNPAAQVNPVRRFARAFAVPRHLLRKVAVRLGGVVAEAIEDIYPYLLRYAVVRMFPEMLTKRRVCSIFTGGCLNAAVLPRPAERREGRRSGFDTPGVTHGKLQRPV